MTRYIKIIIALFFTLFTFTNTYAQCENNGNVWNESWVSCQKTQNPNPLRGNTHWILYEFHESAVIETSHIWNANRSGESGLGASNIAVDYSTDGQDWNSLTESFDIPQASESDNYAGVVGPDFGGQSVSKILITILSTYDNDGCASIAEIQFNIDSEACNGEVDECGVCNGSGEITWYYDGDNDGLGTPLTTLTACDQPANFVANDNDLCDDGRLGWSDVGPLFELNGCLDCHGAGQTSELDLRSFEGISSGGANCGSTILTGSRLVDIIKGPYYADCGSISILSMNDRASGEFDAAELALLQQWIDQGAKEYCTDYCEFSGQPCNDGDDCTTNDTYDINCNCYGTFTDIDQDGFCGADDCNDNDPTLPASIGSNCNDYNPNTQNDVIQSDGCTCLGTSISSECNVTITSENGVITITGLTGDANVKLFDAALEVVWSCAYWIGEPTCEGIEILTDLIPDATYYLSVESEFCQEWIPIVIQGGEYQTCSDGVQNQGETGIDCGGPCEPCPTTCNVEIELLNTNEGFGFNIIGLTAMEYARLFNVDFEGIWECSEYGPVCQGAMQVINLPGLNVGETYYLFVESQICDLIIPIIIPESFTGDNDENLNKVDNTLLSISTKRSDVQQSRNFWNDQEFDLFPNPSNGEIFIQSKSFAGLPTTISIYNHLGQKVKNIDQLKFPEIRLSINLNYLPEGLYYVTLQSGGKVSNSKKIIILSDVSMN